MLYVTDTVELEKLTTEKFYNMSKWCKLITETYTDDSIIIDMFMWLEENMVGLDIFCIPFKKGIKTNTGSGYNTATYLEIYFPNESQAAFFKLRFG